MRHIPLRRRVAAACTGVVAVGALTLAGLTGSATAAPEPRATPASAPDAALLRAMERDLGLTPPRHGSGSPGRPPPPTSPPR